MPEPLTPAYGTLGDFPVHRRMVLLGHAHARPTPGATMSALYPHPVGCTGHRLCRAMGLTRREYLSTFDRRNLLDYWPGRNAQGTGDAFPRAAAREALETMLPHMAGRTVLVVGKGAADIMDLPKRMPSMEFRRLGVLGTVLVVSWMPHMSGRVRYWNSPAHVRERDAFLACVVGEARGIMVGTKEEGTT